MIGLDVPSWDVQEAASGEMEASGLHQEAYLLRQWMSFRDERKVLFIRFTENVGN